VRLLVETASDFNVDIHIAHTLDDTIRLAEIAGIGVCIELATPAGSKAGCKREVPPGAAEHRAGPGLRLCRWATAQRRAGRCRAMA
jgi:hypothetical protein